MSKKYSEETIIKLCNKIDEIICYYNLFKDYKDKLSDELVYGNTSPSKIFKSMAHRAIYALYRSFFYVIENKKIDIKKLTGYNQIKGVHELVMDIADKDICHNDKNSNTYKVVSTDNELNKWESVLTESFLTDDQLKILLYFLQQEVKFHICEDKID